MNFLIFFVKNQLAVWAVQKLYKDLCDASLFEGNALFLDEII
jgi:hypothetical protein